MCHRREFWTSVNWRRAHAGAAIATVFAAACAPVTSKYSVRTAAADSVVRAAISTERSIRATDIPINTIGVLPLSVVTTDTTYASMGFGVAALMANDLSRSKNLIVVERLRLDAVLRELNLVSGGRVDSTSAPRLGRIVGARRVVVGGMTIRPGGALQMGSQVANATTGVVDAALSSNATVTQIFDAEKAMVFRLFDALGVTLSPSERRTVERVPTRSLAAFLAFSNGARAEFARDYAGAVANYRTASRLDPNFIEPGERVANIENTAAVGLLDGGVSRAALLSTDLVNRQGPVVIGSAVDAPVTTRQQLLTITITVRTP